MRSPRHTLGRRARIRVVAKASEPGADMILCGQFLRDVGLDLRTTRLVRHKDRRFNERVCDAALSRGKDFEQYQASQVKPVFRDAVHIASFVVDVRESTVFAGIWRVGRVKPGAEDDPFSRLPLPVGSVTYELNRTPLLDDLVGRLVIDWGDAKRVWIQRADRQDKAVVEIRRVMHEPRYPGHSRFVSRLSAIPALPPAWAEALRSVRGTYLITHRETGDQYVGAALGANGFLGRWLLYAASGHGGNVRMRELRADPAEYDVAILETVASSATDEDVLALEVLWKRKLGTRVHGLNAN